MMTVGCDRLEKINYPHLKKRRGRGGSEACWEVGEDKTQGF